MTSIMPPSYPPLPLHSPELDVSYAGYLPSYAISSQHSSSDMEHGEEPQVSCKRNELGLRASLSTPNIRLPQQQISEMQQSGEKKRNKLGYHRTSVACGHCRRRKIRCIPSPSDVQGRCINCIRLKKECSFYPVDQPPPTESRSKSGPQSSTGQAQGSASASSSPGTSSENLAEQPKDQVLQVPAIQQAQGMAPPARKPSVSETSPPEIVPNLFANRPFDGQAIADWVPPDVIQRSTSKPDDLNPTWASYMPDSPMSSQLSPFTHAPPLSATWTSVSSDSGSQNDFPWGNYPPPLRSMSYGGEPLNNHQPTPYHAIPQSRQFDRRASAFSAAYPSPLSIATSSIDHGPASSMNSAMALSAGSVPPSDFEAWHQQTHARPPLPYYKGADVFGHWNIGDSSHNQLTQTNDTGLHHEEDPVAYYSIDRKFSIPK